ncbi:CAIB/BAIF family enzyme [Aspergillus saccharolyticus JOP 1030-1]|uniref:CAIB/BAIF family enzyme n=1 Tax=Aspergillus saccharolyticus JOP 1030-1 TaxID=1450539 RepID=A0A318ZC37_9EURO|nr:CAIB/BAIF family enzyme [Aspergillus saccharolyticus JOP 1030-1]PYH44975.1 CAIB/BAIF family enzyme [Aspergillus saccharolyticus JOP 1030-1]
MAEGETSYQSNTYLIEQARMAASIPDRSAFSSRDSVAHIWRDLGLPEDSLQSLDITDPEKPGLPSSYKIGHLAQASIALSTLLAAQIHSLRNDHPRPPAVTVPFRHACVEFNSWRLYTVDGKPVPRTAGSPVGGLHRASDGYVRVHDGFPNHRDGAKALLGCSSDVTSREEVAAKVAAWRCVDLEQTGIESGLAMAALRSYEQWDVLPQAQAIADTPIRLRKIGDAPVGLTDRMGAGADKCLRGLRVLEMSRVIAAPLSGKTLAAHGADVLWVTSPNLPDLPELDRELGRGKRTIQLDLQEQKDADELFKLLDEADVFLQGYRPGSLAARKLSPEAIVQRRSGRGIICANMSAYGPEGPWSGRRGFDSLVQTCSGLNVSEAQHFAAGEAARPLPCQALDYAGGFFLAAGVMAALYKQATEGGSWQVDVSLAGAMKYLRSLGQYEGKSGFDAPDYIRPEDVPSEFLETHMTGFGEMTSVRHSGSIDGVEVGWEIMPKPLGSDEKQWL